MTTISAPPSTSAAASESLAIKDSITYIIKQSVINRQKLIELTLSRSRFSYADRLFFLKLVVLSSKSGLFSNGGFEKMVGTASGFNCAFILFPIPIAPESLVLSSKQ